MKRTQGLEQSAGVAGQSYLVRREFGTGTPRDLLASGVRLPSQVARGLQRGPTVHQDPRPVWPRPCREGMPDPLFRHAFIRLRRVLRTERD